MKKYIWMTFLLVCILPSVMLRFFDLKDNIGQAQPEGVTTTTVPTEPGESNENKHITVNVLKKDKIEQMSLEEYVFCVVLAEMPAEFDVEALKAQAVVARTYTCKKLEDSKHKNADVCTDSACCQAYMDTAGYLLSGGTNEDLNKIRSAVESTAGEVLKYGNELIEATYFSCSGGKTEDAAAVWGSDVPYLQAVDSPGEEKAAHFTDTVRFSVKEFSNCLGQEFSGNPGKWIEHISYTEGGGVASIVLQGTTYSGTEIRQKLGLRSTAFVMTITGDTVTVTTKGFGHRVGMSQYGAEAMAVQGSDYREILDHYYTDTTLSTLVS